MNVNDFVRSRLPPPPARVLEVGCGAGELALLLAAEGYDIVGIDPKAPEGAIFRQVTLEEFDEPGPFDVAVAVRALHHVDPLAVAFEKLASLAPLLILDEFAPERLDATVEDWYHAQRRMIAAAGVDPGGPDDLDEWRARHADLHPSGVVLAEARARYDEEYFAEEPYLYRWLKGPATEPLERALVDAGAIPALGYRFVGRRRAAALPPRPSESQRHVSSTCGRGARGTRGGRTA